MPCSGLVHPAIREPAIKSTFLSNFSRRRRLQTPTLGWRLTGSGGERTGVGWRPGIEPHALIAGARSHPLAKARRSPAPPRPSPAARRGREPRGSPGGRRGTPVSHPARPFRCQGAPVCVCGNIFSPRPFLFFF